MKREIAWYVDRCLTCRMAMVEHQGLHGKLQPLVVPMWKWEKISMDFITNFPKTAKGFVAIWVVKVAYRLDLPEELS